MKKIIFVKTRYTYDSYVDFWSLVELSGFETCYSDTMREHRHREFVSLMGGEMWRDIQSWKDEGSVFIVSPVNGEYGPDHFKDPGRKAKVIWWNLERPLEQAESPLPLGFNDARFDEQWVSDKYFAECNTHYRYVTLGTNAKLSEKFKSWPSHGKKYDVIHLSYMSHRRQKLIPDIVAEMGWTVAPNSWGEERHLALLESRAMLAIHQDNWPVIEPLRYALAAAYGLDIIGEKDTNHYPWIFATNVSDRFVRLLPPPIHDPYNFKKLVEAACG